MTSAEHQRRKANDLFIGCVSTGSVEEVLEILGRLHFLPEFGMNAQVSDATKAIVAANDAVNEAKSALARARQKAENIALDVTKNWTPKQINKATGY